MNLGTLKQARWLLVSAVNFKGSRLTLGDRLLGMPVGINLFRVIEVGRPTYRGWHHSLGLGLELYGKGENLLNITDYCVLPGTQPSQLPHSPSASTSVMMDWTRTLS